MGPHIIKYVASIVAALMTLMAAFGLGASNPMSDEEATAISEWLSAYLGGGLGVPELATRIFLNNLAIALMGLVPAAGPLILVAAIYESGRFLGWLALEAGLPADKIPVAILAISTSSPIIHMEFLAYSISAVESIRIAASMVRRALRRQEPDLKALLRRLAYSTLAIAVLLAIAALLEAAESHA